MQTALLARELARLMRWDGDTPRTANLHFNSIAELHHTLDFISEPGRRLKSPGGAGRPRELGCRSGGEQNGEHRHGLGHGDQGRVSYGEFREHNGLG